VKLSISSRTGSSKAGRIGEGGGDVGGLSVGVLRSGTAELVDLNPMLTLGSAGLKQPRGEPGSNDGIDGVEQNVVEVETL
jgi:hypothetical protein